jgi:hypothetical protein
MPDTGAVYYVRNDHRTLFFGGDDSRHWHPVS